MKHLRLAALLAALILILCVPFGALAQSSAIHSAHAQTGQQYRYCGKGYENWSKPYTVTPPPAAPAVNPPPAADVPATGDSTPLALLGLLAALSAAGMWLMKRRAA